MKFIVDELPKNPRECPFHEYRNPYINDRTRFVPMCKFDDLEECKIGTEGFVCEHLREFKAYTEKQVRPSLYEMVEVKLSEK